MTRLPVLWQRNFFLLFCESLISYTGDWVLYTALPYYVYTRTGSALAAGGTFIVEILPSILLGSIGGVLADRWERKRTIVLSEALMGVALLPILVAGVRPPLPVVYLAALVVAVLGQAAGPASRAALPCIVEKEHLVAANSAFSAANNIGRILGSSLGGVLIAAVGLRGVVLADALSFLLAAACVAAVNVPFQADRPDRSGVDRAASVWSRTWREWLEGMRLVLGHRWITVTFVVVAVAVFGDGMFTVLAVPFVRSTLHGSALVYGWVLTARGAGGLIGTLIVPQLSKRMVPRMLIGWSAVVDGVAVLVITIVARVPVLLIFMVGIGIPVIGFYVSISALLQRGMADELRGRIFGAYGAVNSLMVLLGMVVAGAGVGRIGIVTWMLAAGALYVVAGVIALAMMPKKVEATEDIGEDEIRRSLA